jgi:resuscitation-promoting factor RpfA
MSVLSKITTRSLGMIAGLALVLGIGLATGLPAEAATRTVWDDVARCESGGNWKINTGNGYYGGLQFSSGTWSGFGGKAYASQAHRATKSEQIAIARRVLAVQGRGAWPSCGRRAGLTKQNGKADRHATPSTNPGVSKSRPVHKTITVKRGDTIRKLAERHNVEGGWKGLWKLNKKTVKDPNRIEVGQVLKIN